jgi:hypothetical protein
MSWVETVGHFRGATITLPAGNGTKSSRLVKLFAELVF